MQVSVYLDENLIKQVDRAREKGRAEPIERHRGPLEVGPENKQGESIGLAGGHMEG